MAAAWLSKVTDRPHHAELRFDAVGVTLDAHDSSSGSTTSRTRSSAPIQDSVALVRLTRRRTAESRHS